ncbi:Crp/Fnr family transcriptional regulator [Candidatus Saccharibacteria bacterium]|nr:Crp/Fnr family transcriptional regulator [Candidatus Saccharibacteria bacterium]
MEKLFANVPVRQLAKGQILIYEGDTIQSIFFLVSGYVKVSNILVNGARRTIFIYAPGDAFPLTSFLSGIGVARYFYETITDVEVKVMPHKKLQSLIQGDLKTGEELIAYTYNLNEQFIDRIEMLSERSARHKVAALLAYLSDKTGAPHGDKIRLKIPLTSQSIADMCSLTRETASMQIIQLRKDGVISGTRFLNVDQARLKKLVNS